MNRIPDLRITLELGTRRRVLRAAELAPRLRGELVALAATDEDYPHDVHSRPVPWEPTEGNVSENEIRTSFPEPLVPSPRRESSQTGPLAQLEDVVTTVAVMLASTFDDPKSLPFYRLIAGRLPLSTIRSALAQSLELAPEEVKRSRAAYFTAILRPHLARRSST
jgi:hypothetical protein